MKFLLLTLLLFGCSDHQQRIDHDLKIQQTEAGKKLFKSIEHKCFKNWYDSIYIFEKPENLSWNDVAECELYKVCDKDNSHKCVRAKSCEHFLSFQGLYLLFNDSGMELKKVKCPGKHK